MQYLLLIYDEEQIWKNFTQAESAKLHTEYVEYTKDIIASGNYVGGDALKRVETATTVRVREGKTTTTDGPFAETREVLGGYYLVEAKDLDEAIKLAARIPSAKFGSIEIRPIQQVEGMPGAS
jgi:hypothetical protein